MTLFFLCNKFETKGETKVTGKEFRRWRRELEISQGKVAEFCDVDKSTICRWEKGLIKIHTNIYNKILDFVNFIEKSSNL